MNADVKQLLGLVRAAHGVAASQNENASSTVVIQMAKMGKPFPESLAAALLTLGEYHAPITLARSVLFTMGNDDIRSGLTAGMMMPGYGNSFFKNSIDPAWSGVDAFLQIVFPDVHKRIMEVGAILEEVKGRKLYPNAAAYTAAAANLACMSLGTEYTLLIEGRLETWARQWRAASF